MIKKTLVPSLSHSVSVPAARALTAELPVPAARSQAVARETLNGKRAAMVVLSCYPDDSRVRRAAKALIEEGMTIDLVCLAEPGAPKREKLNGLNIHRVSLKHYRSGKLLYFCEYGAFILAAAYRLAVWSLRRRYHVVYIHNMPDVLVASAVLPKLVGAKVVLDMHDPMPELMRTIYRLEENSRSVRMVKWLEKWSMARADMVITVNRACKNIFGERSCSPGKIKVIMNAPDEGIFAFRAPPLGAQLDGGSNKEFVIMYHGSLVERNGLDLAVDAVAMLRESIPNARLRVYGAKTAYLEQVMASVQARGLDQVVQYAGPRTLEQLVGEIEQCDVGVIPNHLNPFTEINTPTRIFEFLSMGKPVIAPRTAGVSAYFNDASLLFFEAGNAADLARTLVQTHAQPQNVTALVQRGQEIYRQHTWELQRQAFVNCMAELLA